MKKLLMFLLSVMILSVTGCGSTKEVATDTKSGYENTETENDTEAVTTETPKEEITVEEEETTTAYEKVTEEDATDKKEVAEESSEKETPKQEESSKPTESPKEEKPKQEPAATEKPKQEPEKTPEPEPEPVPEVKEYSPDSVVAKAIAKCQAGGMITTQDNLANALAEGRITQEEYNEYYPYDGLENSYYSVFVETDLNTAGTTSGQPLRSEDAIATYIADMLLLENSPVFNIVYAGVHNTGGTDFYEFRCLR
ncbi:hypothetical protein [Roseburia sp. 831b]|uniref:hypothetical protein n=1 Tax=Roseburia sp. 831b TaxID=1261635 RepID=UPI000952B1E2|nr:hypothetical protein [Roseburia sp. 831b]WVK74220.1 hypothetical protein BIV16_06810 [Roseburia sp. 831b]